MFDRLFRRLKGSGDVGSATSASAGASVTEEQAGGSTETAIVINAPNSGQGVAAEYQWIARNLPGYKMELQELLSEQNGKSYDRITLAAPNGARRIVYFDITAFFGKF